MSSQGTWRCCKSVEQSSAKPNSCSSSRSGPWTLTCHAVWLPLATKKEENHGDTGFTHHSEVAMSCHTGVLNSWLYYVYRAMGPYCYHYYCHDFYYYHVCYIYVTIIRPFLVFICEFPDWSTILTSKLSLTRSESSKDIKSWTKMPWRTASGAIALPVSFTLATRVDRVKGFQITWTWRLEPCELVLLYY